MLNLGGLIDPDYTGEIKVILLNLSNTIDFCLPKERAIAQFICERAYFPKLVWKKVFILSNFIMLLMITIFTNI